MARLKLKRKRIIKKQKSELSILLLILLVAVLAILSALTFFYDGEIINFITGLRISWLTSIFLFITHATSWYILIPAVLLFCIKKNTRRTALLALLCLAILLAIVFSLKLAIPRERPSEPALLELEDHSFPSGHAATLFGLFTFLFTKRIKTKKEKVIMAKAKTKNKKEVIIFISFTLLFLTAFLGTFSRLYLGVHYLSDIMWGTIIGVFAGYIIARIC